MTDSQVLENSDKSRDSVKSGLARLLAKENIAIRHEPDAETAHFDLSSRELVLPLWKDMSNDLYDMLLVHETGHAIDTPTEGWIDLIRERAYRLQTLYKTRSARANVLGAFRDICNIVEDIRVDTIQKKRYPGSVKNYRNGLKELWDTDWFFKNSDKTDINDFTFADRINLFHKGGSLKGILFSDEEQAIFDRAKSARTFNDVLDVSEEIFKFMKMDLESSDNTDNADSVQGNNQYSSSASPDINEEGLDDEDKEEPDTNDNGTVEVDGENDDSDDELEETDSDSDSDSDDGDDELEETDSDSDSDSDDGDDELEETDSDSTGDELEETDSDSTGDELEETDSDVVDDSGDDSDDEKVPEVSTPESYDEVLNAFRDTETSITYLTNPNYNPKDYIDDYSVVLSEYRIEKNRLASPLKTGQRAFNKFKAAEKEITSYMAKEFELKKAAVAFSRTNETKTGRLNVNKLYSYRYNEDIFVRSQVAPKGKNHGMIMIVDFSISMNTNIRDTFKQVLSFCFFCNAVQIPFEVYSFTSSPRYSYSKRSNPVYVASGEFSISPTSIRNIFSSRMSVSEFNEMAVYFWTRFNVKNSWAKRCLEKIDPMGFTPLHETILMTYDICKFFKEHNDVEILNVVFLTDGFGSSLKLPKNFKKEGNHRIICRDKISREDYCLVDGANKDGSRFQQKALFEMLKNRVDINLIGFYLTDISSEEGYVLDESDATGYDQYYMVDQGRYAKMNDKFEPLGATNEEISNEFIAHSRGKKQTRAMLSKFIEKISTDLY